MADVTVYGSAWAGTNVANWLSGPYWVSPSTGYIFLSGAADYDVHCYKTSNSGASWAEVDAADCPTSASGYSTLAGFATWFDKETPGDSGTKIHMAYVDDDNTTYSRVKYVYFDTSTDQWSTPVTVRDVENSSTDWQKWLAITKSVGAVLFIAGTTNLSTNYMYRSTDGSSWTSKTAPGEAQADRYMLFCANLADTNDIWCLFQDASVNDLSLKTYDDSANSWSEATIHSDIAEDSTHPLGFFDGAIRHSDGHLLACAWTLFDNAAADLATFDITDAGTITAKGDCVDTSDDCAWCAILINQQNDDVYIAYLGNEDGSQTAAISLSAFYKKSTNGMTSWGAQTAYSSGAADDYRVISAGRTVGDAGGRFMPAWFDDDDEDIWVNDGNDVEIAAASSEVDATITGVIAEAPAAALAGTIAAVRIVAITGTVAEAPTDALAGSVAAQIAATVTGAVAEAPAEALAGSVVAVRIVSITGTIAEAPAEALAGVIAAHIQVTVNGEIATAPAEALAPTIATIRIAAVTGEIATAPAEALVASVAAVRIVSVTGEIATADAEALAGTVETGAVVNASVTGTVAEATAEALAPTVAAVRIASITGVVAEAPAEALAGAVTAVRIVDVTGEIATAPAEALAGSVAAVRIVAITGELATAAAEAPTGTVATVRYVSITGELAEAAGSALAGTVTAIQTVSVAGEIATAAAEALAGSIFQPATVYTALAASWIPTLSLNASWLPTHDLPATWIATHGLAASWIPTHDAAASWIPTHSLDASY